MIDLKAVAGDRWRVTLDESAVGEPRSERPWMYRVAGRKGHVFVQGPGTLAVWSDRNRLRASVLAVPGAELARDGDREFVATFPAGELDTIAKLIKARKRRVLTPEQRERLASVSARGLEAIRESRRSASPGAAP